MADDMTIVLRIELSEKHGFTITKKFVGDYRPADVVAYLQGLSDATIGFLVTDVMTNPAPAGKDATD